MFLIKKNYKNFIYVLLVKREARNSKKINNMRHTKGEWEKVIKHRGSTKRSLIKVIIPSQDHKIVEIGRIGTDGCLDASFCCAEEHANAQLISAAPDMLDALKMARGELVSLTTEKSEINIMAQTKIKLIEQAIAKAEGEASSG